MVRAGLSNRAERCALVGNTGECGALVANTQKRCPLDDIRLRTA
jgi:hypothetical protein